jgi:hypothetical protein
MTGLLALLLLASPAMLASLALPMSARAATPDEVEAAIRKGVAFLYSRQRNGNWETAPARDPGGKGHETSGGQWGGLTSIATYALLAAGEKPLDPRIMQACDFLRKADIVGNYALGMRAQVWLYLPRTDENKQAMLRDAQLLIRGLSLQGRNRGLYDYIAGGTRVDLSVSQYGVLGMWAAADFLEEVPPNYWREVENAWLKWQDRRSGGWAYKGNPDGEKPYTPSITAAGVATLFITQEFLYSDQGLDCKGNITNPGMQAIERGLAFMAKALPSLVNRGSTVDHRFYTLYGVERIGVASGYKYFDKLDWYQVGAEYLVRSQRSDGSWGSIPDTCFALLFLSRGRAPVMMNKVRYTIPPTVPTAKPVEGFWNQRPRDAANITRWVGKQSERVLNWQIIDLSVATVLDLHDSPILYLAGSQKVNFSDDDKKKIKEFIDQGGLVLANADCGSRDFATAIRELANELYPIYEMRPLPQTHPIYTNQQFVAKSGAKRPELQGVSNGARELILLVPAADAGRAWQKRDFAKPELFELAANIYLYVIDKTNSLYKGQTYLVSKDTRVQPTSTLVVGRARYAGNWDPEPGGWKRLANVMHNKHRVTLQVREIDISKQDVPDDVAVLHLTGTTAFKLDDDARKRLKAFTDRGGLFILDSCGGGGDFNTSAEAELSAIFGEEARNTRQPLPSSHTIYSKPTKLETIGYRTFARGRVVGSVNAPRLRGIERGGKLVVAYSGEDLSVGLVGQPVDGIVGYTPETATEIMARLLLTRVAATSATTTAPTTPTTPTTTRPSGPRG